MLLFRAGDQLPVIPLFEVRGSADSASPWHIGATAVKVGIVLELLTFNCAALLTIEWLLEAARQ